MVSGKEEVLQGSYKVQQICASGFGVFHFQGNAFQLQCNQTGKLELNVFLKISLLNFSFHKSIQVLFKPPCT